MGAVDFGGSVEFFSFALIIFWAKFLVRLRLSHGLGTAFSSSSDGLIMFFNFLTSRSGVYSMLIVLDV